jgi:hypothetical protein
MRGVVTLRCGIVAAENSTLHVVLANDVHGRQATSWARLRRRLRQSSVIWDPVGQGCSNRRQVFGLSRATGFVDEEVDQESSGNLS